MIIIFRFEDRLEKYSSGMKCMRLTTGGWLLATDNGVTFSL